MYSDIWYQVVLFFVFFGLGILCAFVFDAFRVSERFCKSNIIVCALKDILFWLVVTLLIFAICLRFNNGEFRFFMFVGILFGAMIYFNTISKFVLNALFFVVNLLKKIIGFLLTVVLIPLKLLIKVINKPMFIAVTFSKKSVKKLGNSFKFKLKKIKIFKR